MDAINFVKTVEIHQYRKIACMEEIAYLNGWIRKEDLLEEYEILKKNQFGQSLKDVLDGKYIERLYWFKRKIGIENITKIKIIETKILRVVIFETDILGSQSGYFTKIYNKPEYEILSIIVEFVQDNKNFSVQKGTSSWLLLV